MTTQTEIESPPRLTLHESARRLSDLFCLWRLCGKPGCRRAQACRGGGHRCLGALSLVPAEAFDFAEAYDRGLREGLSFEEMMARSEAEWEALQEWCEAVTASLPQRDCA